MKKLLSTAAFTLTATITQAADIEVSSYKPDPHALANMIGAHSWQINTERKQAWALQIYKNGKLSETINCMDISFGVEFSCRGNAIVHSHGDTIYLSKKYVSSEGDLKIKSSIQIFSVLNDDGSKSMTNISGTKDKPWLITDKKTSRTLKTKLIKKARNPEYKVELVITKL